MSRRNPLAHASDPLKACADLIRQMSHRHSTSQVFRDFVMMAATSLANAVEPKDSDRWQKREAIYLAAVKRYSRDELEVFARMLARVVEGLEAGPCDFLGELFMGLSLGNEFAGQFFTPFEVSKLMARMLVGSTPPGEIQSRGFQTLNEPACGAGGMVLAYAEALREAGYNYQQQLHVTAQDIDLTAVQMCYVQLALCHIPAIVIHGNSLAVEVRDYWVTPAHVVGGWDFKLAVSRARSHLTADAEPEAPGPAPAPSKDTPDDTLTLLRARVVAERQMALF